jgi:hypothetical protein
MKSFFFAINPNMNRPFSSVYSLILLLFLSLVFACKKENKSVTASNTATTTTGGTTSTTTHTTSCGDGILCVRIDSEQFVGDSFKKIDNYSGEGSYAVYTNDRYLGPALSIYGSSKASGELVELSISNFKNKADSFSVNGATARFTYTRANNQAWATRSANSGNILLTKYDTTAKLVSGIFNCTVISQNGQPPHSYTLSSGSFTNLPLLGK